MTRRYRQGDSSVRSIGRIPDHRKTMSKGVRGGSGVVRDRESGRDTAGNSVNSGPVKREPGATLELLFRQEPDSPLQVA